MTFIFPERDYAIYNVQIKYNNYMLSLYYYSIIINKPEIFEIKY